MSNIIDISSRIKTQNNTTFQDTVEAASVTDIVALRNEKIKEDRRQVKRTILTEFVSVHAVIPGSGIMKVALHDINHNGLAFDVEEKYGHFNVGDEVELRVYLNHQTYFRIDSKIARTSDMTNEGFVRHGAEFLRDAINTEALDHFIGFLETVTANLRRDGGDILVSKINS